MPSWFQQKEIKKFAEVDFYLGFKKNSKERYGHWIIPIIINECFQYRIALLQIVKKFW